MDGTQVIRLKVPGSLRYRDIAVRAVAEACRLVGDRGAGEPALRTRSDPQESGAFDLTVEFDAKVVSAFSEIYNNIALHAYKRKGLGDINIELSPSEKSITVRITDTGDTFDMAAVPAPALESLPEGGMGLHIAHALLDELDYQPGPPNVWRLTKHVAQTADSTVASGDVG